MGAEITNQTRLEPQRRYSGPEFLQDGFRPLFFLAGLWAALSVPLWIIGYGRSLDPLRDVRGDGNLTSGSALSEAIRIAIQGDESMNKSELGSQVASQFSLTRATADNLVSAVFSAISETLAREENVTIAGFGTFSTNRRAARKGRNPRTGESIDIAASTAPSFKPGKMLRDAVNGRKA